MPACHLVQKRKLPDEQVVPVYHAAILLHDGDRFSIYDPAEGNELVRGATQSFIDSEVKAGRLIISEAK